MAEYFPGRRKVVDPFFIDPDSKKIKVRCTVFERWVNRGSRTVYCGDKETFEGTKSVGITETTSETIQSTLEGEIGVKGVAKIKSTIQGATGHSVQWNVSTTEKRTFEVQAPKCGRKTSTAYALFREYELIGYKQGGWLFKSDYWDEMWEEPVLVAEETGDYASVPDTVEWDERCRGTGCSNERPSPEFDGRLSLDFGPLSILVPYKLLPKELRIRIENFGISYPIYDYHGATMSLLREGLKLQVQRSVISPMHLFFLGDVKGDRFQATSRIVNYAVKDLSEVELRGAERFLAPNQETLEIS